MKPNVLIIWYRSASSDEMVMEMLIHQLIHSFIHSGEASVALVLPSPCSTRRHFAKADQASCSSVRRREAHDVHTQPHCAGGQPVLHGQLPGDWTAFRSLLLPSCCCSMVRFLEYWLQLLIAVHTPKRVGSYCMRYHWNKDTEYALNIRLVNLSTIVLRPRLERTIIQCFSQTHVIN